MYQQVQKSSTQNVQDAIWTKSDDNRSVGSKQRGKMRKVGFLIGRQEGRKQSSNLDQCERQMYDLQAAEMIKTEA